MGYLHLVNADYPNVYSKAESIQILQRYKSELNTSEYDAIHNSLCSHALEYIYLNEKDILLSIAQLRNEITLDEIVALAKAS
ncbi:MAG: hypothetical protein U9N11_00215 [Campylobacterota bacterium]|nr:hypothetical protein [Campylobacterota bacterium]